MLSKGYIESHLMQGTVPPNDKRIFRVSEILKLRDRVYQLAITDSHFNFGPFFERVQIRLDSSDSRPDLPKDGDWINLAGSENVLQHVNAGGWKIEQKHWIIRKFSLLPIRQAEKSPVPSSSSLSSSSSSKQPKTPIKRAASPNPSTSNPNPVTAKKALVFDETIDVKSDPEEESILRNKSTHEIRNLTSSLREFTICGFAAKKEFRPFSLGKGLLFTCHLHDGSGEIKAVAFDKAAEKWDKMIEPGKVFYLSNVRIKTKNIRFNQLNHAFELALNEESVIEPCTDQSVVKDITLGFYTALTPLMDIPALEDDSECDVIATVDQVEPLNNGITRVSLADESQNVKVSFVLGGNDSGSFPLSGRGQTIGIKKAKVQTYGGVKELRKDYNTEYILGVLHMD